MLGTYPFLFNFPLLQKLSISAAYLKWDLEMLAGLPMLKELECTRNGFLSGNIDNLRVLKDTLEKVTFRGCENVEGNFMALADFPQLRALCLFNTNVTGDIGRIGNDDFSTLEELYFWDNKSVSGNIRSLRVLKETLQKLSLDSCRNVEGDFMALADFPQLRSLHLSNNTHIIVDIGHIGNGDFSKMEELFFGSNSVSGNIRSLRVLKDTLQTLVLKDCHNVEGNFMDLADFLRLWMLYFVGTPAVTGDIRDIGADDFSKLKVLFLPSTIYSGNDYELQRISEAPELMRALNQVKKQHPSLTLKDWAGGLSVDSPDWYDWDEEIEEDGISPPFRISLVVAGTRIGYRWRNDADWRQNCEVNWLDSEPDKDSSEYGKYIAELQETENVADVYKGYHQPPSREEFIRLVEEWRLER